MPARVFEGRKSYILKIILSLIAVYIIYTLTFTSYEVYGYMVFTLLWTLPLTFIFYSSTKKDVEKIPWYDYLLSALSFIIMLIVYFNYEKWIFWRLWLVDPLSKEQIIIGLIIIVLVIEAVRRTSGIVLAALIAFFVGYLFLASFFPALGIRIHPERVVEFMTLTPWGIYSKPLEVISTYVVAFTLLGAIFSVSGVSDFLIELSKALVGHMVGGAAKVAVIASSLMGTVSGSAVANVYTTGIITIPAMKSTGVRAHIAGAVEAVASTGGQLMPPIMGAGAFIMAELLEISYLKVATAALIPAILYYVGIYTQIHYYAKKDKLKALPKSDLPNAKEIILKKGYLLIPLIILVYFIAALQWSPITSAFISFFVTIAISLIRKETRLNLEKLLEGLSSGISNAMTIIVVGAGAGMVAGTIDYSGLSFKFTSFVASASMGSLFIALLFVTVLAILLGMGMPTSAAYIIAAAVAVPAITRLGVEALTAHMFVFWFAILSAITPPVALAAYAAATLANDEPVKIAVTACKLGIVAFIIPFLLIYKPSLMLVYATPMLKKIFVILTSILAAFALGVGVTGYMNRAMKLYERALIIAGALVLFIPAGVILDAVGIALVFAVIFLQSRKSLDESQ